MKFTLRAARTQAGLSADKVGTIIGLTGSAIMHWERHENKRPLKPYQKEALCRIYSISEDDILWPNEGKEEDDGDGIN